MRQHDKLLAGRFVYYWLVSIILDSPLCYDWFYKFLEVTFVQAAGIVIMKDVPFPSSLSMSMVPWCSITT